MITLEKHPSLAAADLADDNRNANERIDRFGLGFHSFDETATRFTVATTIMTAAIAGFFICRSVQFFLNASASLDSKRWESDMRFKHRNLPRLLATTNFIPQAIVEGDVKEVSEHLRMKLEHNVDDLDGYAGVAFLFHKIPVAVMRYAGHPKNQYTIYLPFEIRETDTITRIIHDVVIGLKVSEQAIMWERKDDPDL